MPVQVLDYPLKQIKFVTKPVTLPEFEAFLRLPENQDRLLELIHGEIVEKMPTEEHGTVVLNIGIVLGAFIKRLKLGRAGVEIRYKTHHDALNSRLPDLSFNLGHRPVVTEGAVPHMPDLAIEVRSPDDTLVSMREKAQYYLENGVRLVWLVFPHTRTIEVYTLDDEVQTLTENDILTGGDLLPGFSMPVAEVFENL